MKVSFIGGGNMGEAILAALIANKLSAPEEIAVSDISSERRETLKEKYGVFTTASNLEAASRGDIVLLAVKPQHLEPVLTEMAGKLRPAQLVLSIVAGRKIASLREGLKHEAVLRAMPNTPAQIGKGITVWTTAEGVTDDQSEAARALLGVMGQAIYTHDENVLDMATALSGSGPAYVFMFLDALIDAGVSIGLTPGMARALTYQTVLGSTEYAERSGGDLDALRRMVTSPGGTTAAAVTVLNIGFFSLVIKQAVDAAYQRAKELGS